VRIADRSRLPAVSGRAVEPSARAFTLGNVQPRNDRLVPCNHSSRRACVVDVEDELARGRLVILAAQQLVALGEVVALLTLPPASMSLSDSLLNSVSRRPVP